jgi:hypothetical protein
MAKGPREPERYQVRNWQWGLVKIIDIEADLDEELVAVFRYVHLADMVAEHLNKLDSEIRAIELGG